jgi:hypothetical protein
MKGEESDGGEREDDIGTENWNQTGTLTSLGPILRSNVFFSLTTITLFSFHPRFFNLSPWNQALSSSSLYFHTQTSMLQIFLFKVLPRQHPQTVQTGKSQGWIDGQLQEYTPVSVRSYSFANGHVRKCRQSYAQGVRKSYRGKHFICQKLFGE